MLVYEHSSNCKKPYNPEMKKLTSHLIKGPAGRWLKDKIFGQLNSHLHEEANLDLSYIVIIITL